MQVFNPQYEITCEICHPQKFIACENQPLYKGVKQSVKLADYKFWPWLTLPFKNGILKHLIIGVNILTLNWKRSRRNGMLTNLFKSLIG